MSLVDDVYPTDTYCVHGLCFVGGEHVRTAGCPTPTDLPVSASSHSSSPIQSAPSSSSSSSNLPMEGCWTVVSASVVWQRMLRVLGDVNKIQWPAIHGMAMTGVRDIWKRLEEVRLTFVLCSAGLYH